MRAARIEDADTALKPPTDWNADQNGHCSNLPIKVERVDGVTFMFSVWEVEGLEALTMVAGGKIRLGVSGTVHPVVNLGVQAPCDQVLPVSIVRQALDREGQPCVEVETMWPPRPGSTIASRGHCTICIGPAGMPMAVGIAFQELHKLAKAQGWVE